MQKCRGERGTLPFLQRGQITGRVQCPVCMHAMQVNHGFNYPFCWQNVCAECRLSFNDCDQFADQGRPECLLSLDFACGCLRDSGECIYKHMYIGFRHEGDMI